MGLTLVRRKWSGQLVPSAASFGALALPRKSSTTSESVKCPTMGRSCDAMPRMVAAIAAALARRSATGSAAFFATALPNGSFLPWASM